MDASEIVLLLQGRLHSAEVGKPSDGSLSERFLGGLSDDQMRLRPAKHMNSLVWLVWHMARAEDVFVNLVVARGDQVLDEAWVTRLAVARWDIGTGMTESEVTEFSDKVNVGAVIGYRDAVGQRSREFVARMQPEGWKGVVEAGDVQRAIAARAFGPRANWLEKTFQGRTRAGVLAGIMIIHNAEHLGEALTVRSLAGLGLPM